MVKVIAGWAVPAVAAAITAAFAFASREPNGIARSIAIGCAVAAVLAYASTVALKLTWNGRLFWLMWALGLAGRFVFVGIAAYVILSHTQLNFVATMASLIGFTSVFLVLESATCLKKG